MKFAVDAWDPGYGISLGIEADAESATTVDPDVEIEAPRWSPVAPTVVRPPEQTIFVDGVRRIDARLWIATGGNEASMAVCASYAAGAVCCCAGRAHVLEPLRRRGLFTVVTDADDVVTSIGTYPAEPTTLKPNLGLAMSLSAALQLKLSELEILAAVHAHGQLGDHALDPAQTLTVVDGPVRGREQLPRVLGFVKSHLVAYLPPELHAMVGTLSSGERTPVFRLSGNNWDRFTWYLRLPGSPGHPWAGIARVECATNIPAEQAIQLATLSQAVLPRFASAEYKDPRAPQNLYPVSGLERDLRHRLGSREVLFRALRRAAVGIG